MKTPRHDHAATAAPLASLARISRAWAAWRSERRQPAPLVEELEARLMYAADPAGAGLALAGAVVEQRLVDNGGEFIRSTSVEQRSHELLIVGAGIADSRTLLDGLARDGRDIEVLELDPAQDGMDQISAALAGRHDLAAIHILSHGASGELQLGADTLDAATLAARAGEVGRWGDALRAGGDILLYGCDVAAGDAGAAFVRQLSTLTGADVAASDNLTGDSSLHADWTLEFSSGHIDSAAAFTAAAQAQWHGTLETRVNTVTQHQQHEAAVAVGASGNFVVTWTGDKDQDGNNTGVFAQRFAATGNLVGAQIQVNTATQDRQEMPTVGVAADGSFVVAWASHSQQTGDTDGWSVKAQRFAANGATTGAEFLVNQSTAKDQWQPSIAVAANGQFVIAWASTSGNDIALRHYDASGNALGGELQASGVNGSGNQSLPSVAIAADGSYVVAWQSDYGGSAKSIFAQRFNADDTLRGAGFRVNTYDADDQTQPSVAVGANGAFVIAWTSAKQDGDLGGIYAQLYKADGSRDGAEFRVNTVTAKDQNRASAAMDGAGNFTIAWSSDGKNNGANIGVYAQRYGVGGVPVGGAFLVNTTISGNQIAPAAAMNASGALAIAWEGEGVGDKDGVFVSNYVASNTAPIANPDAVGLAQGGQASASAPGGVLANDRDPDTGGTLSVAALVSPADGSVLAVPVAGVSVAGVYGSLQIFSDGSYLYSANSAAAMALAAGQSGVDTFTYVVQDNNHGNASSTLTFTVAGVNDVPVAGNDFYAIDRTKSLTVLKAGGVLVNDADPDRNQTNALTVVSVNGITASVGNAVTGSYGTLQLAADGSLTYVPDNSVGSALVLFLSGQTGPATDTFSYGISDGNGGSTGATIRISILGNNRAPIASDDGGPAYTVQQDGSLVLNAAQGVLLNDSDPDGNTISAQRMSDPAHGTLLLNADGSFVYTPNASYYGADSFTYFASDGSLNSGTATVRLDVVHVNHAPVAAADSAVVTEAGSTTMDAASGLLANDSDIDAGDQRTVTDVQYGDTIITLAPGGSGSLVTDYGTLFVGSDGAYRYVADGPASMTLSAGAVTGDAFTYTISDGYGGTATAHLAITISGVNDAPVIAGTAPLQSVDDNSGLRPFANVTIADADSPAQQLVVRVTLDDADKGTLSSLAGGSYDIASGVYTYTGLSADATGALRALVFTPAANRVTPGSTETTRFTITADDGLVTAMDTATSVTSASVDDAPSIAGTLASQSVDDNASLRPFANVTIADADSPAQQLVVRVALDDADKGTLSNLGGGSFDPAGGVYTFTGTATNATTALRALVFTPAANRVAPGSTETTRFSITADDGSTVASDATTAVTSASVDDAPSIAGTASSQSVNDNARLQPFVAITVADADSPAQRLTLRIMLDDPAKGSLSGATGSYDPAAGIYTMSGTAAQLNAAARALQFAPVENRVAPGQAETVTFSLAVSDGTLGASGALSIKSVSVNDPPAALAVSARGAQDGAPITVVLAASDADTDVISLVIDAAPAHGALYLDAARLSPLLPGARLLLNGNTAQVYFVPEAGWNGDTGFSYTAVDAHGLAGASAAVSIAVTPVSRAAAQTTAAPAGAAPAVPAAPVAPVAERSEETAAAAAQRPALLASVGTAAVPARQPDAAPPAPETVLPAQSNQQPPPVAAPARSSAERASQAAAAMLAIAVTPDAGGDAMFDTDLGAGQALNDARIERASAAARSETLARSLDEIRDNAKAVEEAEHRIVGSSVAVGASFSVGYVIWLLRGGVLATSLLSSLPAWRFVDPLPVLARMRQDADDEDDSDDSLESLVAGDDGHGRHLAGPPQPSGSDR